MKLVVDVIVKDLDRATRFYTNVLGFPCRRKEKEWSAIVVGDAEIHLYRGGGISSGLEFYVEKIDEKVSALKRKGIEFVSGKTKLHAIQVGEDMITTFPWGRTAFFKDSEGNELALVEDFLGNH